MVVAQETAHTRQPVVILFAKVRIVVVFGLRHHGAELIELEGATAVADALLTVEGWTAVFHTDTQIDDCHRNGKHHHGQCRQHHVEKSLQHHSVIQGR